MTSASGLSKKYWKPGFVCIILHKRLTTVAGLFLGVVSVGLSTTVVLVLIATVIAVFNPKSLLFLFVDKRQGKVYKKKLDEVMLWQVEQGLIVHYVIIVEHT
jgi:hypothetical protein